MRVFTKVRTNAILMTTTNNLLISSPVSLRRVVDSLSQIDV